MESVTEIIVSHIRQQPQRMSKNAFLELAEPMKYRSGDGQIPYRKCPEDGTERKGEKVKFHIILTHVPTGEITDYSYTA